MSNEPLDLSKSKILVVDDKKENLEVLTSILEEQDYDLAIAMDGEKAIQIAAIFQPELILLDVMMPGIDGHETCRRLKSLPKTREIPVIFVTAKNTIDDIIHGFQLGAVDYVVKPIRQEEVVARVATHLQLHKLINIRDQLIEQLSLQNLQLTQLAQEKDRQLEESEKLNHLGELVGELTHELGTPLGLVNTAGSMLEERNKIVKGLLDTNKLAKSNLVEFLDVSEDGLNIILSNLRYAIQLITSFKQIIVGEFSESVSEVELKDFLSDIEHLLTPRFKKSPHHLHIDCPHRVILRLQVGALSQILLNLISNALNHAFSEGVSGNIKLSACQQGERVVISVCDDGNGIAADIEDQVFDKYFTSKLGKGGSGLGLYIVKQLVEEKLAGVIALKNSTHGCCFEISLPDR